LYEELKYPSWSPFAIQRHLKDCKEQFPQEFEEIEHNLIQTGMSESDDPFVKLHLVIKQLRENIEEAREKLPEMAEKWSAPKKTTNLLLYGSMTPIIAIPAVFLFDRRLVTANNIK
ncbi:3632_t:CDS:2, partial [Acaulospora morrowiae]